MTPNEQRLTAALERIRDLALTEDPAYCRQALGLILSQAKRALVDPEATPDTRPELTGRQAEIYGYIKREIALKGCPPTVREIGTRFKISSPNGVACHLDALRKKGYLRWSEGKSRTLAVIGATS